MQYSLCGPHAFRRKWGPWIGVVLGVTGAGILLDGLFLQDASLSVGGLACVGVSLAVYVISGGDPVKLHKLEGGVAWLDGIHRSIVEGIPAHPRPLDEIIATRGLVLTRSDDESSEDLSSPDRVPCPDEGCVGAVGADGRCGTCGALAR